MEGVLTYSLICDFCREVEGPVEEDLIHVGDLSSSKDVRTREVRIHEASIVVRASPSVTELRYSFNVREVYHVLS